MQHGSHGIKITPDRLPFSDQAPHVVHAIRSPTTSVCRRRAGGGMEHRRNYHEQDPFPFPRQECSFPQPEHCSVRARYLAGCTCNYSEQECSFPQIWLSITRRRNNYSEQECAVGSSRGSSRGKGRRGEKTLVLDTSQVSTLVPKVSGIIPTGTSHDTVGTKLDTYGTSHDTCRYQV